MDVFETSARILSLALGGASHASIVSANRHLQYDEIGWLLKMLVDRRLIEPDPLSTYYVTTIDGIKFLEIQFNMERMLRLQRNLV